MKGRSAPLLATLFLLVLSAGCGSSDGAADPGPGVPVGTPVPDFALADVNPNSATYQTDVSPRHALGQVSAWYFGHAT